MTDALSITTADPSKIAEVKKLLQNANLPFDDIDEHFRNFVLAMGNGTVIGAVGIEAYGTVALLRSFVVNTAFRGKGIGVSLLDTLIKNARKMRVEELYLLTTTAQDYFLKHGFTKVDRSALPPEIRATKEFNSLCPVSAICMRNVLTRK